jgi:hypothetical protein
MDMVDLEVVEGSLEAVLIDEESTVILVVDIGHLSLVSSGPE